MKKTVADSKQVVSRYENFTRGELVMLLDGQISGLPAEQRDSVNFSIESYRYPHAGSEHFALFMNFKRPETDEEETRRKAQEAAELGHRQKRDRDEYERLKKQFG